MSWRSGEARGVGSFAAHAASIAAVAALCALIASPAVRAEVLIGELMYHPLQAEELEYLELHNTGGSPAPIAGWSFTGITYTFPAEAEIPAGGRIVLCRSKTDFQAAYPSVPAAILFGNYTGALDNAGESISLRDAALGVRDSLTYQTDPPWDFLADGFGASLERICFESTANAPENWRASAVPPSAEEFGGTPGSPAAVSLCPPEAPARPSLFISEVMYHPVLERDYEDNHEFIEIWNGEPTAVSLAGWRLAGAIDYTFGPGASVGGSERVVVARKKSMLVAEYGLDPSIVHGDYARTLDNGGEKVALIASEGQGIDSVTYDDDFPWPIAADALGADDEFLRASLLPLSAHQYRGISLERVSFDAPSGLIANWAPSPLDGATPGSPNASARSTPLPIVEDLLVQAASGAPGLIRAADQVRIQARFSPSSPSGTVDLQYFLDDVAVTGETITTVALKDDGAGEDLVPGDGVFSVVLPARSNNTIVRYRVRADLEPGGAGVEVVSPRPTDPNDWHAYFVSPVINTQTRVYQVFISPANWTLMWDNIQGGRVSGCAERTAWDAKVPAVFVYEGKVTEARVRYQGSRYNRTNGPNLSSWSFPGPTRPSPVRALSWRITLPRYGQLDGATVVTLNKLTQGCPGYDAAVGFEIFRRLDIPAATTRFSRLHVNGGYYHYMLHIERPDEDMIRRYNADLAEKYPERPREEIGHLFKSAGCNCDEGPYGWGDERRLLAACGHSALTRYSYTYDRKTWSWAGHVELMDVLEDLNTARQSLPNTAALRTFLAERFDLDRLIDYVAVLNWSVPFDDMFQNHFLYQRRSDGKWMAAPWDLDLNFGGWKGANASLYMGEQNDPDNRSGWWNYLKDAVIKAYRPELEARILELTNSVLAPASINAMVDAVTAQANPTEAAAAPAGIACGFPGEASAMKSFASARRTHVTTTLATALPAAGPDQTVLAGATVQFDATASRPDPGPGVTYTWSNGMTGERPVFRYDNPGTYVVTLTITVSGVQYRDSVTITVVPAPDEAFEESNGTVVMEAESYYTNDPHGSLVAYWEPGTSRAGYSGDAYMLGGASTYTKFSTDFATTAPELRYTVLFRTPGTYRVWVRGFSDSADYDSVHTGLDSAARDESFATRFNVNASAYQWSVDTRAQGPQTVDVDTPGVHFFSLWIRESGQIIDKVILTQDDAFVPNGAGPAESPLVPISTGTSFVRGNANRDAVVDLSDGIAILLHLFAGGSSLACEDAGDVNDDGTLGITDAIALLDFLFRGGQKPRPPFPAAGLDPTADAYDCGG